MLSKTYLNSFQTRIARHWQRIVTFTCLEANHSPASFNNADRISRHRVNSVQRCSEGSLAVNSHTGAQHPEMVAMEMERVLFLRHSRIVDPVCVKYYISLEILLLNSLSLEICLKPDRIEHYLKLGVMHRNFILPVVAIVCIGHIVLDDHIHHISCTFPEPREPH